MFTLELFFIGTYQGKWPFGRDFKIPESVAKLFKIWTHVVGILEGYKVMS